MQRGPKPIPSNLRLLQGAQAPRQNREEPKIETDQPDPPAWMNDYAMEEWRRLADLLYTAGILTTIDQTMLAAYCMAYARWRRAEEDLEVMAKADPKTHGALMLTKEGNAIQNPLVGVANVARRDMARLAAEFGLSPSSRTLLKAPDSADETIARRYGLT